MHISGLEGFSDRVTLHSVCISCFIYEKLKLICLRLTGEALTQSSLLEADGEDGDSMVTMTTTVEPMNLHHAMLRSPGRRPHTSVSGWVKTLHTVGGGGNNRSARPYHMGVVNTY